MQARRTLMVRAAVVAAFLAGAAHVPVLAAQAVQGSVGNVSASDGAALGRAGCRVWSTADGRINANQAESNPTCVDARCLRSYNANPMLQPGGYICNGENTVAYSQDAEGQTFYQLVDAQAAGDRCSHTAFYAVQGIVASSNGNPTGDFRQAGCPGPSAVNCFDRADAADARSAPLTKTNTGYAANAHSIPSIGGFSPVPVARAEFPGPGCAAGEARVTWDDPELYKSAMKNGAPSPVTGVRLYTNGNGCGDCPDGNSGWVAGASFPVGAGAAGTCVPITGPTRFALTVRLSGPNSAKNAASEVETGRVGASGFVGAASACIAPAGAVIRIASLAVRHAHSGEIAVEFASGVEQGVRAYYVTRGDAAVGPFARVSSKIAPQGSGSTYTFGEKPRSALGRTLYYAIEIVNADGSTQRSGSSAVILPAGKSKLGS